MGKVWILICAMRYINLRHVARDLYKKYICTNKKNK